MTAARDLVAAYHESGHVLAGLRWGGDVRSATLGRVADGAADGQVLARFRRFDPKRVGAPFARRRRALMLQVRFLLGGGVAEVVHHGAAMTESHVGNIAAGATVDLDLASAILREMYPGGRLDALQRRLYRETLRVMRFLLSHRGQLRRLASALLEHRRLSRRQIDRIIKGGEN